MNRFHNVIYIKLLPLKAQNRFCRFTRMETNDEWQLTKTCSNIYNKIQQVFSRWYGTAREEKFTVVVEGNIGSGKTSLLQYFSESCNVETFMEPVNKWRNVKGHNALAKMYEDTSRWALTFQTYVQLTMLETHIAKQSYPVKMMERSIYSARYCFVENLYKSGKMPEFEAIVLGLWFDFIIKNKDCHVDLIVYLRTKPEVLFERIQKRGRKEEKPIPLEYLQKLHDLHEEWLIDQTQFQLPLNRHGKPAQVLILDANQDLNAMKIQFEEKRRKILLGYT